MKVFRLLHIIILLITCPLSILGANNDDEIIGDTLSERKIAKWYNRIGEFRKVANNKAARDSFQATYNNDYWKLAAITGKLNLQDTTIKYPRFVKFCVDAYNWGDRTFNSYDTTYVVGTGKRWKLMTRIDNMVDFYDLKLPQSIRIGMSSHIDSNIGAYLSYMAVGFGYTFNIDNLLAGEPIKRKRFDFNFNCSLIALDAYYSKNTGTTSILRLGNYYKDYNIFDADYRFSGVTLEAYGLDLYYFFNNKRYSQGAAYSYSKYQKKSAGSFIGGLTISRQNVKMDFNLLPDEIIDELPSDKRNYHINYNDYCVMLGYGYNWVFRKNWLLNATAIPCFGFNHSLNDSDGQDSERDLFSLNVKTKLSLVYNHNRFFYSLNGKYDGHFYKSSKYRFINSYSNVSIVAGFRF